MDDSSDIATLKTIITLALSTCKKLRMSLSEYCRKPDKTHRTNVLMDFVRRIECNLYAIALLAKNSMQHKHKAYLKLPMGIILRNCFVDSIYAFYFIRLTDEELEEEVSVLNRDYVKSLKYRKPVYIGKLKEAGIENAENLGEMLYPLTIEDTFTQYLSFETSPDSDGLWSCVSDKEIRKEYTNDKNVKGIDQIYKQLKSNTDNADLIDAIYANYKYFSQFEHFSEYSHGDTLVPYGEDNTSFPFALKVLRESTSYILKNVCIS